MSTISVKIRAEALGKTLENISEALQAQLNSAIGAVAHSAYSEAIRLAQEKLHSTQLNYINNLSIRKIDDNIWTITLFGKTANDIENGYPGFSIRDNLLKNATKTSKDGSKYVDVPLTYEPFAKSSASPKTTDLRSAALALIKQNGIDKIIRDQAGAPIQGVVARIATTGSQFPESYLSGLTKIQKTYNGATQSTYLTFRRVSEKTPANKWLHPGFKGVKIFDEIEQYIETEIDRIIEAIL